MRAPKGSARLSAGGILPLPRPPSSARPSVHSAERCLPTAPRQQAATRRWPKAPRRPMAPCRPNVWHRPTSPPWPLRQRRWLRRLTSHPLPTPLRRLTLRRRTPQGRRSGEEETSLPPSHAALCCNSSGRRHPHRGGAAVPFGGPGCPGGGRAGGRAGRASGRDGVVADSQCAYVGRWAGWVGEAGGIRRLQPEMGEQ